MSGAMWLSILLWSLLSSISYAIPLVDGAALHAESLVRHLLYPEQKSLKLLNFAVSAFVLKHVLA